MLLTFDTKLIALFLPLHQNISAEFTRSQLEKYAFSIYFGFCDLALVSLRAAQATKALI